MSLRRKTVPDMNMSGIGDALINAFQALTMAGGAQKREHKEPCTVSFEVSAPVYCMAYDHHKKQLGCAFDKQIMTWKYDEEQQNFTQLLTREHTTKVLCIDFSPKDMSIAYGLENGGVGILNLDNTQTISDSNSHSVQCVKFSCDGKTLGCATRHGEKKGLETVQKNFASIYSLQSASLNLILSIDTVGPKNNNSKPLDIITCLLLCKTNGRDLLIYGTIGCCIYFTDVTNTSAPVQLYSRNVKCKPLRCLAWSPDFKTVFCGTQGGNVHYFDVSNLKQISCEDMNPPAHEQNQQVSCMVLSPDGKNLVTVSWDKTVKVFTRVDGANVDPSERYKLSMTFSDFDFNKIRGIAYIPSQNGLPQVVSGDGKKIKVCAIEHNQGGGPEVKRLKSDKVGVEITIPVHWECYNNAGEVSLDIETTGLSSDKDDITVACLWAPQEQKSFFFTRPAYDRKSQIQGLIQALDNASSIIAFYGRKFDITFIFQKFEIEETKYKAWLEKLVDPFEEFKKHGGGNCTCKLNDWAEENGLRKIDNGVHAISMAEKGQWDELEKYCMHDAQMTWMLCNKVGGTSVFIKNLRKVFHWDRNMDTWKEKTLEDKHYKKLTTP